MIPQTLFLVYPSVSTRVLGVLVCKNIDGTRYLTAGSGINC